MSIPNPYGIETLSIYTDTDRDSRHRPRQDRDPETDKDLDLREIKNAERVENSVLGLLRKEAELSKPTLSLKDAAFKAHKSEDTITRWCRRYGIGKQLHKSAPWRVDPVGLAIVVAGDADALEAYQNRKAKP